MVSARISKLVLKNEYAVIPVGVFNPKFDATLSKPGVLGRATVSAEFSNPDEERQGLFQSAARLKAAGERIGVVSEG